MTKLGALATAAVTAVGMCSLATDASAARGGGAHFGGGGVHMGGAAHFSGGAAHFGGGAAHFGGPRVTGNAGRWDGARGFGFRRYGYSGGGYAWGGGVGYPAYTSCYAWTPLGYVNECGYDYNHHW
jgi:hypothetical protein